MNLVVFIVFVIKSVESANILCFFTTPSYSYSQIYLPICKELAVQGHKVTMISPNAIQNDELTNLFEIDLQDISYNVWDNHNSSERKSPRIFKDKYELMDFQLSHPEVKGIINNEDHEHFDLCIFEYLQAGPSPLIDVYGCPLISVSATPLHIQENDFPSHSDLYPYLSSRSFMDRLNRFLSVISLMYFKGFDRGIVKKILDKHYGKTRGVDELLRESSLIFVSVNPILHAARLNVPAVIEFSGIHIKPEKPLPQPLQSFMDNSKHGVIYMSFGSKIKSNLLPEKTIRMILNTLAELPYKVLWKFYSDYLPVKPFNVEVRKWFPQQDILRHPNLKLFITQGGLQSLDEAIYTKTPVVVIPFEGDQFENAKRVEEIGMGKSIEFSKLNKDNFKAAVLEAIKQKYSVRVNELHNLVEDKPVSALNNLIWWCEYVLRHKGAAHLRNPAIDMPFYIYYMLDVAGFVLAVAFAVCFSVWKLIEIISRKMFGSPQMQPTKKEKKKNRKHK